LLRKLFLQLVVFGFSRGNVAGSKIVVSFWLAEKMPLGFNPRVLLKKSFGLLVSKFDILIVTF
jgi:hypothetical protein